MTFIRYLLQLLILVSVGFGLNSIFRKSPLQIGEALVVLLIGASFFILTLMLKHAIWPHPHRLGDFGGWGLAHLPRMEDVAR